MVAPTWEAPKPAFPCPCMHKVYLYLVALMVILFQSFIIQFCSSISLWSMEGWDFVFRRKTVPVNIEIGLYCEFYTYLYDHRYKPKDFSWNSNDIHKLSRKDKIESEFERKKWEFYAAPWVDHSLLITALTSKLSR